MTPNHPLTAQSLDPPVPAVPDVPQPRSQPDMARLEDLTARHGFAVYDPTTPGGFRELTDTERALLTPTSGLDERAEWHEHLALSEQRAEAARAHLAGERARADRAGDAEQAAIAREGLRVLNEETARDLRNDPRVPSRAELDELYARGEAAGWDEMSARAWEYADARRDIADQRAAALDAGDTDTVTRLDDRHALLDHNYLGTPHHQPDPEPGPATERPGPAEPGRALTETEQALRDAEHTAHLSELAHDGDPGPAHDAAALHALHGLRPAPQPETHADREPDTDTEPDAEVEVEVEVDDDGPER